MARLFENIKFYLVDKETGLVEPRFVCSYCGRELNPKTEHVTVGGLSDSYLTSKFYHPKCWAELTMKIDRGLTEEAESKRNHWFQKMLHIE